jgi:hypothetical protein
MTTGTRTRKPLEPVHGTARVTVPVGQIAPGVGEVVIDGKRYTLVVRVTGYRLHGRDDKRGEPTVYDLPLTLDGCDCNDATYRPHRPGGCKHARALRALVAAGRLPAVAGGTAA